MTRVLWIVQDGVLSGPGASQSVPYLRALSHAGHRLVLLSVEKSRFLLDRARVRDVRESLREVGVAWSALPFGTGPALPRTALQMARLVTAARSLVRRHRIELIHARSYLPALVASRLGRPFLFDMRGLWPREKVDAGLWREGGLLHRAGTALEGRLLRRAAAVVVLADGAREFLPELDVPFRVVPTGADPERFRPGLPPPDGAEELVGREVFILAGALSSWYLLEETLDLLAIAMAEDPDRRVLLLSEEDTGPAERGLEARGVGPERVVVRGVPHDRVPFWFSLGAVGILLIRSAPSKRASAPTKLGELLACGVPVMTTPKIGDTEELLQGSRTGVIVRDHSPAGHRAALTELKELRRDGADLVRRCRSTAIRNLSVDHVVREYRDLYDLVKEHSPCV